VDGSSSRYRHDVGRVARLVAANVGSGRVFNALLGILVFRDTRCGPIFFLGFPVNDEPREGICSVSIQFTGGESRVDVQWACTAVAASSKVVSNCILAYCLDKND
jgi:hypothetical protein